MGSLIDYLTGRGLAEQTARTLALSLVALLIAVLLALATLGYARAVTATQAGSFIAMTSPARTR